MTTTLRTVTRPLLSVTVLGTLLVSLLLGARPSAAQELLTLDSAGGSRQVTVQLDQPCRLLNGYGAPQLQFTGPGAARPVAVLFSTPGGELLHSLVWPADGSVPLDLPRGCRTERAAGTYLITVVSDGAVTVRTPLTTSLGAVSVVDASKARLQSRLLTGAEAAPSLREDLVVDHPAAGMAVLVSYEHFAAHVASRPELCVHPAPGSCPIDNSLVLIFPGPLVGIFAGSTVPTTASDLYASFEDDSAGARLSKLDLLVTFPAR